MFYALEGPVQRYPPVTSAAPVSVSWVVAAALDTSEIRGDTAIATLHTLKVPSHYKPNVKG